MFVTNVENPRPSEMRFVSRHNSHILPTDELWCKLETTLLRVWGIPVKGVFGMKGFQLWVAVAVMLGVLVTGTGMPVAYAAEQVNQVVSATSPDTKPAPDQEIEPDNWGLIIRSILIGAMSLWRYSWFRTWAIDTTRRLMGTAAAAAINRAWEPLGRTVQNLIGMDRLSWTIVSDNFLRTLMNNGESRPVATNAAMGLREFLKGLANYFN